MEWSSRVLGLHSIKSSFRFSVVSFFLFLSTSLFTSNVYAADFTTVLNNLSKIIAPLTSMVLVICFVIGIGMIFSGLVRMKKFGQIGTMYSQPGEIHGPIVSIIVGAVLIYIPTSTDFLMNSLFQTSNSMFSSGSINYQAYGQGSSLLSYGGAGGLSQQWAALANTLVLFIQFLGFLSFIKGMLLIGKTAAPGSQPGQFSKGLTHVIGGVVLINFIGAFNVLKNTIYGS